MRRLGQYQRSAFFASFFFFICLLASPAWSDTIPVGVLFFDSELPGAGGSNGFTIGNFTGDPETGGGALPPDFPVLTPLTFTNSLLLLFHEDGTPETISLGTVGPGFLSDPLAVFPETIQFGSALFTATFNDTSFLLSDGRTFDPDALIISSILFPSIGSVLVAGDFALIEVTGTLSPVPLPASWLLMGSGLIGLWAWRLKAAREQQLAGATVLLSGLRSRISRK